MATIIARNNYSRVSHAPSIRAPYGVILLLVVQRFCGGWLVDAIEGLERNLLKIPWGLALVVQVNVLRFFFLRVFTVLTGRTDVGDEYNEQEEIYVVSL